MLFRGQTLGKYKVVAPLGSGGFGAVYRARDTWIDKDVAIKVPHKQNLNFTELLQEPRLLAALDHPNIVSITTAEKQDNLFFIVMEYVSGATLETIVAESGGLTPERAADYTVQIARALAHAHEQGVIHRDLRPPNILVSESGVLKVADFGTSRFLELAAHGTTVIGSPPYMAPEQFAGKAVFASDLYSLGITMYQMLTGVLPYEPPPPNEIERLMSGELVRAPRLVNPAVPKALNDIVMKALAPDVSGRYQRAADLLCDLESTTRPAGHAGAATTPGGEGPVAAANDGGASGGASGGAATQAAAAAVVSAPRRRSGEPTQGGRRICRSCHRPLHARAVRCPFCGEAA